MFISMRKLCPNYDKEDGLDTVLEVPIPEEMFTNMGSNGALRWQNLRALMRAQGVDKSTHLAAESNNEFMALLKLVGTPLIPFQVQPDQPLTRPIKDCSINPDLWYLELVVSGFKVSAGSDGKVAWNQSSSQPSHANKGPPRPLRRFFQGLDPRCTANLFLDAVCIGEKTINDEDCFILKLETAPLLLKAQCTPNTEIVHHTVWGYFSQRTGLLVQFEDTKLVRMKSIKGNDSVFWETSMESMIQDYRYIDGINIAHGGRTNTTLYRYGEAFHHRRKIEESWRIEEVDFNICGLSMDCFLPPSDLKREQDGEQGV
ncbi:hypothetical protein CFP56_022612 [Quercus suber]|uniref:DUF620 domain-containing protein n=1 Tax=Quercus suber TaxID=58331 RepID=A0AAW0M1K8_QUESU